METKELHRAKEIIKILRAPSNWLKQPRGEEWKSVRNVYDRTPFDAADLIEKLIRGEKED